MQLLTPPGRASEKKYSENDEANAEHGEKERGVIHIAKKNNDSNNSRSESIVVYNTI